MTKNNYPRKAQQITDKKRRFSKLLKIGLFWPFSNFKPKYFCNFCFLTKQFFFPVQTNFCFSKKNYSFISQIQPKCWTHFGGPYDLIPPQKKNEKSDFASIVVKRKDRGSTHFSNCVFLWFV
jgi:hypothetical protein